MINFIISTIQDLFGGMELLNIACFIYIFRNMLSFFLWIVKQAKKSVNKLNESED